MMRFDYLHDPVPSAIERLRSVLVAPYLQAPLLAMLLVVVVEPTIYGMLRYQLIRANDQERAAHSAYVVSRVALERVNLEHTQVIVLVHLDRRILQIRKSGAVAAERMLDIANHLPRDAWLTSLSRTKDGELLLGRVDSMQSLGDVVREMRTASTVTAPELIDARSLEMKAAPAMLSFRLLLADRPR
ncbi:MAG: hypothetical protein ACYDGM_10250 [Vulcanimicrobiaceae bacterium]